MFESELKQNIELVLFHYASTNGTTPTSADQYFRVRQLPNGQLVIDSWDHDSPEPTIPQLLSIDFADVNTALNRNALREVKLDGSSQRKLIQLGRAILANGGITQQQFNGIFRNN